MNEGLADITKAKAMCISQNKQDYEEEINACILTAKKIIYYKQAELDAQFHNEVNALL